MRIYIDSCVFIRGILDPQAHDIHRVFLGIGPDCKLIIPRLIAKEVTRNLPINFEKRFYDLFDDHDIAEIADEPPPKTLIRKYIDLDLREKGDAIIAAFVEMQQINCLISDNRHFLRELNTPSFTIISPADFIQP